jgi:redox-sensitive bicupin YhaK (pirin superfamily)
VTIHQDVDLYAARLAAGERRSHRLRAGRKGWVQVARGRVDVNGVELGVGDGVALADEPGIELHGVDDAEILVFDMAG